MLFPKIVFSLPSGFFFSVVATLNFAELDGLATSLSLSCFQNLDRLLLIGQVTFQMNFLKRYSIIPRSLRHFRVTLLQLTNMKHIVHCRKNFWQLNFISDLSFAR